MPFDRQERDGRKTRRPGTLRLHDLDADLFQQVTEQFRPEPKIIVNQPGCLPDRSRRVISCNQLTGSIGQAHFSPMVFWGASIDIIFSGLVSVIEHPPDAKFVGNGSKIPAPKHHLEWCIHLATLSKRAEQLLGIGECIWF